MSINTQLKIIKCTSPADWEKWLASQTDTQTEIWLQIAKKASGITTVTYDEALDVALCYGWIDGVRRSFDEDFFIQRFTPRRPKSNWSKRNVEKVLKLIKSGKMQRTGLAQVEAAQADGRWKANLTD